jgi:hypothetical protein
MAQRLKRRLHKYISATPSNSLPLGHGNGDTQTREKKDFMRGFRFQLRWFVSGDTVFQSGETAVDRGSDISIRIDIKLQSRKDSSLPSPH